MEINQESQCMNCNKILGFHGARLLKLQAKQCNLKLTDIVPMCAACISISHQIKNNFSESEL